MPEPLGLDHTIYQHSPLPGRPDWTLPNSEKIAVAVVVYIEDVPDGLPDRENFDPRLWDAFVRLGSASRARALYEYGNNVGVFRILDALDRLGVKPTLAVNSCIPTKRPQLAEHLLGKGFEVAGHNRNAFDYMTSRMGVEGQKTLIESSLTDLEAWTGERPQGWFSQGFAQSHRTVDLLHDAGVRYFSDYGNDDQPYLVRSEPTLVSVPNQSQWDDVEMMGIRRVPAWEYQDTVIRAFDQLAGESTPESARVFGLHLHPWVAAMPHHIKYVEAALEHIIGASGVWQAPVGTIAEQFASRSSSPLTIAR
ncbi:MAG: polysaccharide deacetylase [Glaciihabitans sp.]|nr:polysaccharide deacetylase [Glaciihabitans sp.]